MSFEEWWAKNKALYELVGVKEYVAKAIWIESALVSTKATLETIREITEKPNG
jgi:hypothetical protein